MALRSTAVRIERVMLLLGELEHSEHGALRIAQNREAAGLGNVVGPDHQARATLLGLCGAGVAVGDLKIRHPVRRYVGWHVVGHRHHAGKGMRSRMSELRVVLNGAGRAVFRRPAKELCIETLGRLWVACRELA